MYICIHMYYMYICIHPPHRTSRHTPPLDPNAQLVLVGEFALPFPGLLSALKLTGTHRPLIQIRGQERDDLNLILL